MAPRPRLSDVVACLDAMYPPGTAESWDAVGLVCGDPSAPVARVMFAVDPVYAVVEEAIAGGADLVVTHHPLLLRPVHDVAATTPKGRVIHRLISAGVALHVCHTNADSANPGVSDAMAAAFGLSDVRPLAPAAPDPYDKVIVFAPVDDAETVLDAMAEAGAGAIGDYDRCAWSSTGIGTFRPQPGANPTIGAVGQIEQVQELRLEMVAPRSRRDRVVEALRVAHPYEEPAFDVYEVAGLQSRTAPGRRGIGRVGTLPTPTPLTDFADMVARALPPTQAGVRVAGDPEQLIRTVALCGGAGDSLLDAAHASRVDAYVTSDLRHHPASELLEHAAGAETHGIALVDVSHWAAESLWLPAAADRLVAALGEQGTTVKTWVSQLCTDPWTLHVPSP